MRLAILAVLALVSIGGQARADEQKYDGNELLTACRAVERVADGDANRGWEESKDFYYCVYYLRGFLDATATFATVSGGRMPFCAPDGVTTGQQARIVVKYLREHPAELQTSGGVLALMALIEAYPCADEKSKPKDKL